MGQRRHIGHRTILALALLWAALPLSGQTCEEVEARLDAGFLDEARTELAKVGEEETPGCREALRERLADGYRERGEQLLATGSLDLAEQSLDKALLLRPGDARTRQMIETLSDRRFDEARQLLRLGEVDAAREKALAAIGAAPESEFPADLDELFHGPWEPWRAFRRSLVPIYPTVLELLAVVLGLVFVGIGLWRYFAPSSHRLTLEEFQTDAGDGGQQSFTGLIRHYVADVASGDPNPSPTMSSGQVEALAVPDVVAGWTPGGRQIAQALNLLLSRLSRRWYKVTGVIHPSGDEGLGVTLHLARGSKTLKSATLWQKAFSKTAGSLGAVDARRRLAEVAGVWLVFALADQRWPWRSRFHLLGTRSWRAFAYFRIGVSNFERRRSLTDPTRRESIQEDARYWFVRALQEDAELYGARVNLGWLSWADPPREGLRHLAVARRQTALLGASKWRRDEVRPEEIWSCLERTVRRAPRGYWFTRGVVKEAPVPYFQIRQGLLGNRVVSMPTDPKEIAELGRDLEAFARHLEAAAKRAQGWTLWPRRRENQRRNLDGLVTIARATLPVLAVFQMDWPDSRADDVKRSLDALRNQALESFDALFVYNTASALGSWTEQRNIHTGEEAEAVMELLSRACRLEPYRETEARSSDFFVHLRQTEGYRELFGKTQPQTEDTGSLPSCFAVVVEWLIESVRGSRGS